MPAESAPATYEFRGENLTYLSKCTYMFEFLVKLEILPGAERRRTFMKGRTIVALSGLTTS